jgi:hypothetical protein
VEVRYFLHTLQCWLLRVCEMFCVRLLCVFAVISSLSVANKDMQWCCCYLWPPGYVPPLHIFVIIIVNIICIIWHCVAGQILLHQLSNLYRICLRFLIINSSSSLYGYRILDMFSSMAVHLSFILVVNIGYCRKHCLLLPMLQLPLLFLHFTQHFNY